MNIITCLILNFLLYLAILFRYHKLGVKQLSFVLLAYYTIVAFMGIFITVTGIYEAVLPINYTKEIDFLPYILCFACIVALIYPFKNVTYDN